MNTVYSDKLELNMSVFEYEDNSGIPSYGKGHVSKIFSTGNFFVKYDCKELNVMHGSSGVRWDKEGKIGARRVQEIE